MLLLTLLWSLTDAGADCVQDGVELAEVGRLEVVPAELLLALGHSGTSGNGRQEVRVNLVRDAHSDEGDVCKGQIKSQWFEFWPTMF